MNLVEKKITACIVDDDKIFTYGFGKLMQLNGLVGQMLDFDNGQEALNFLKDPANANQLPDVVFVDINMPVMNGWEFTHNFEEFKSQIGKNITLYMVSSSVDLRDIERAKNTPLLQDYLLKPLDQERLNTLLADLQIGNGDQSVAL